MGKLKVKIFYEILSFVFVAFGLFLILDSQTSILGATIGLRNIIPAASFGLGLSLLVLGSLLIVMKLLNKKKFKYI